MAINAWIVKKKEYLNFHFKVLFQKSILKKSTQNYSQAKKIKISVDISEIENCWRDKKWLYERSTKLMDLYINYVCEKKIQTTGIRYTVNLSLDFQELKWL